MKLDHAFDVALPVEQAWSLLVDLQRIAPCLPGARLEEVVDGEYRGGLATRIGPIDAHYEGAARFLERDEVARRAVVAVSGHEADGTGTAAATITMTLRPAATATSVRLSTELSVSGRAAQFGRDLLAEAGSALTGEFAHRLAAEINGTGSAPDSHGDLDVARTVVVPVLLRRAAVPTVAALLGATLGYLAGRRFPSK